MRAAGSGTKLSSEVRRIETSGRAHEREGEGVCPAENRRPVRVSTQKERGFY